MSFVINPDRIRNGSITALAVVTHEAKELLKTCPALCIIIRTLGGDLRNGMALPPLTEPEAAPASGCANAWLRHTNPRNKSCMASAGGTEPSSVG
ncbi:hypothetical protein [Anatilimnocola floriformis]|uniref:hypothetical protein n=1 Tax=Anatilimnocola floriformis TaxID=2948575 RepID=UPI0020C28059|nr:hypothetical protein [Anatilimnocola floriformis]